MKKLIILLTLLILTGCGMDVEVNDPEVKVEGETTHTFGPNFEAWYDYCLGQVEHENEAKDLNMTEEEIEFAAEECYYSIDMTLPEIPAGKGK